LRATGAPANSTKYFMDAPYSLEKYAEVISLYRKGDNKEIRLFVFFPFFHFPSILIL
jgi:hypothetical protein